MNIQTKEEQEEIICRFKRTDSRILSWLFAERDSSYHNAYRNDHYDKHTSINVDFFHSSIQ